VLDALGRLDDGPRGELEDLLVQHAVRGTPGWRPTSPSPQLVEDARSFIMAARRVGRADPSDVDDYVRRALTASLAGDRASAYTAFETIFPPICQADIDLGQSELVEDVVSVDLHECVRHFIACAYVTTPLDARADAIIRAIEAASGLPYLLDPIADIERVLGGNPPDLDVFIPLWVARLERDAMKRSSD
jgi:hypothetical protein